MAGRWVTPPCSKRHETSEMSSDAYAMQQTDIVSSCTEHRKQDREHFNWLAAGRLWNSAGFQAHPKRTENELTQRQRHVCRVIFRTGIPVQKKSYWSTTSQAKWLHTRS